MKSRRPPTRSLVLMTKMSYLILLVLFLVASFYKISFAQPGYSERSLRPMDEQVCYNIINSPSARQDCLNFVKGKKIDERVARFCMFTGTRDGLMDADKKLNCIKDISTLSPMEKDEKYIDASVLSEICGKMAQIDNRLKCLKEIRGKKFSEATRNVCQVYPMSNKPIENYFSSDEALNCLGGLKDSKLKDDTVMTCYSRDKLGNKRDQGQVKKCIQQAEDDLKKEEAQSEPTKGSTPGPSTK